MGDSIRSQCSSVKLEGKAKIPSKATKLFNLLMSDKTDPIKNETEWSRMNNAETRDGKRCGKEMGGNGMNGKGLDLLEKRSFDKGDVTKSEREWLVKRFGENEDLKKRISDWSDVNNDFPMNAPSESSLKMPTWLSEESDF